MRYWYIITHYECPVCGRDKVYKERTFDKSKAGHESRLGYDYCDIGPLGD